MKLVSNEPKKIIRVEIRKIVDKKPEFEYLNFEETTVKEVIEFCKKCLKPKVQSFPSGKRTTLAARESVGTNNVGPWSSFHFYGLEVAEVKQIILKNLKNGN